MPRRSPTMLRPVSLTFSDLAISESESPTEESAARFGRRESDAARWLGQFYAAAENGKPNTMQRPRMTRASTAYDSSALPSLIHSPSSSFSTVASMASIASYSQQPLPSRHRQSYAGCPTTSADLATAYPVTAPSSPTQMMKDASLKSIASTVTAFRFAEACDLTYTRRPSDRRTSEAA